jgi:prolyl 4-hydroxylase
MSLNLPPIIAKTPFEKIKIPNSLYSRIMNDYSTMSFEKEFDKFEYSPEWDENTCGGITIQGSNFPYTKICDLQKELEDECYKVLTPIIEEWSDCKVEKTMAYGIRSYVRNSMLKLHRDKFNTHVLSCIIFIDQKSEENWHLDFFDHEHKHHKVFFEPGDMLLYESLCVHGRLTPFNGDYYRNMYFHWRPLGWDLVWEDFFPHVKTRFKNLDEYRLTFPSTDVKI